jgi:hypothetical protein
MEPPQEIQLHWGYRREMGEALVQSAAWRITTEAGDPDIDIGENPAHQWEQEEVATTTLTTKVACETL